MGSGPVPAPSPGAPPIRATLNEDGRRGRAFPLTLSFLTCMSLHRPSRAHLDWALQASHHHVGTAVGAGGPVRARERRSPPGASLRPLHSRFARYRKHTCVRRTPRSIHQLNVGNKLIAVPSVRRLRPPHQLEAVCRIDSRKRSCRRRGQRHAPLLPTPSHRLACLAAGRCATAC